MEARIARLEADVAHVRTDVADIKVDVRTLRDRMDTRMDRLEGKFDAAQRQLCGNEGEHRSRHCSGEGLGARALHRPRSGNLWNAGARLRLDLTELLSVVLEAILRRPRSRPRVARCES